MGKKWSYLIIFIIAVQSLVLVYFIVNNTMVGKLNALGKEVADHDRFNEQLVSFINTKFKTVDANFALLQAYVNSDNPELFARIIKSAQEAQNESNKIPQSGNKADNPQGQSGTTGGAKTETGTK